MPDTFKQDNLEFVKNVGLWPNQSRLPMKRYSDEKSDYEMGVLVYRESSNSYAWFEGANLFGNIDPKLGQVVSLAQIEKLIDDGWMVD